MPHDTDPDTTGTSAARACHPERDAAGRPDRRSVVRLGAAAALGVTGAGALAACSASSGSGTASTGVTPAGGGPGKTLAKLADVPVGGAVAVAGADGRPIVIAQPTAGTVTAFSAKCTHQGCKVLVNAKELDCPCHGSVFDALTGAVKQGPAQTPLPAVAVKVSGPDVVSA